MKRIIWKYGLISGGIMSALMVVTMVYSDRIGIDRGYIVGYTTMVLSFLLVFFGIRAYRDDHGGQITFLQACGVGLAITVISSVCYVVTWEVLYHFFMPDFMDKYGAYMLEKARASGASAEVLRQKAVEVQKAKAMYDNVLIGSAMTFLEPLPVGILITLISGLVLRRKGNVAEAEARV